MALSPGVKQQGLDADHSPPTSADVKKTLIYTSHMSRCFMNFSFFFKCQTVERLSGINAFISQIIFILLRRIFLWFHHVLYMPVLCAYPA
jgi:hypothetical protein